MGSNAEALLSLTRAQHEVWLADQLDSTHCQFNCAGFLDIRGPLRPGVLAAAIEFTVRETEALRIQPVVVDGTPQQVVRDVDAAVQLIDLTGSADGEQRARDWMRADLRTPVVPGEDALFTHAVLRLEPERHLFYLRYHHIVLDGFGQVLYWQRIAEVYTAFEQGRTPPAYTGGSVAELIREDREYAASPQAQADRDHWLGVVEELGDPVALRDQPCGDEPAVRFQPWVQLGTATAIAARYGSHWSVPVLAIVAAYVARLTQQPEVVLDLPVRARTSRIGLTTPGMLSNVLPLRVTVAAEITIDDLIVQVRSRLSELLGHQRYRGEALRRELRRSGATDESVGVTVNLISFDRELRFGACSGSPHLLSSGPVRDLSIEVFGGAAGARLLVAFEADPARHEADSIAAHRDRFIQFFDRAVRADPATPVHRLDLLAAADRTTMSARPGSVARDYDLSRPLHDLVARQTSATPDAVAATSIGQMLTYRELLDAATHMAHWLRAQGVEPGDIVGIHAERDTILVVELLAVLLAGAAYLPLDPDLPPARLAFQIRDCGSRIAVSRSHIRRSLEVVDGAVVATYEDVAAAELPADRAPLPRVDADAIAYVIYTSGSTGQPKGVAVPHRGVVNRLLWMQEQYELGRDGRVLQKTPFTFDVSVWEFFWPLIVGARVHLARPGVHRDPRVLAEVIAAERISTVHFVPSMLDLFLLEPGAVRLPGLRQVFCSGEVLQPATVARFFVRLGPFDTRLYNLYGPTEASIDVTYWECHADDTVVPIGYPVANTELHVVDRELGLLPPGTVGELCIGGVQVASGYLGRPEVTARSFVPDPYGTGMLYRTGDLVSLRRDGALLYHGRLDDQVKIHGFRIEPGEITSALLRHPRIVQAVVTTAEGPDGQRQLVGHLVPDAAETLDVEAVRAWLGARLPPYMVPGRLLVVDRIRLLPNGKVDRATLARAAADHLADDAQPMTERQRVIAEVWSEVLGIPAPGPHTSFFALGGDSMHAIRVRTGLERHGHTVSVSDLLANPSIAQLERALRPTESAAPPATAPFELVAPRDAERMPEDVVDAYPVSAMQAGMLYYAAYGEDSSVYRVVTSVRVAAPLNMAVLREAVDATMARHAALRCSFELTAYNEPLQLVHRSVDTPVEFVGDLSGLAAAEQGRVILDWVEAAKFTVFDITAAPLLRFAVHTLTDTVFQLSVVEHHVILDGWSDMRMLEEIVRRYLVCTEIDAAAGITAEFPEIHVEYRDFVAAEQHIRTDDRARRFWLDELTGAEPTLVAPIGTAHQDRLVSRRFDVELSEELGTRLHELAVAAELPLKTLLITAHLAVLRLVTGGAEVLTGVIANGRLEREGGDETIGVFLNTLPLRLDSTGLSWLDTALAVLGFEQRSAAHRSYPFARIQQDLGHKLQLDSYVNYMDFRLGVPEDLMTVTMGVAETNYPLAANFLIDPAQGQLRLWLDCGSALLTEEFGRRLAQYYHNALTALADDPHAELAAADLRSAEECRRIGEFNTTAVDYTSEETVHGRIVARARRNPDATAVVFRQQRLSYRDLDRRSARLARHMVAQGVGPGSRIGVSLRRSADLVVALVAVLKTGAAYVPMDPVYPVERLRRIAADAGIALLLTADGAAPEIAGVPRVDLAGDASALADCPARDPDLEVCAADTAYVIYTSGSTGTPKGIGIRHRNVLNFFQGMQDTVGCDRDDVVLAVTSVSFDISVLELLWPLTCGAVIVVAGENIVGNLVPRSQSTSSSVGFSLFFAAAASQSNREGYRLVLDAARYADDHGFEAVWTPERHFHEFGGRYPNPSVMSAALATITRRVGLRGGSMVAPLHDVIRIAEEWSLVDNLSDGRVGLAFASGWNSNDFVLQPGNFADRKQILAHQLEEFVSLWRGEPVRRHGGRGRPVDVRIHPAPVQVMPPIWLTSVGTVETLDRAGAAGTNVLTHLLGQDADELGEKIASYRRARAAAGHAGRGRVTVIIHTYLAEDTDQARRRARAPFANYLRSSTELWRILFASITQPYPQLDVAEQLDAVIEPATDRCFETSGLFGSLDDCLPLVGKLADIGVDEIAFLIDFGLPAHEVLAGLDRLDELRRAHEAEVADREYSLTELCIRHGVTLLQGTPSLFNAMVWEPEVVAALRALRAVLIGGESFPAGLAQQLWERLPRVGIHNMYGPTETTVWSTTHRLTAADAAAATIPIGRPIANTVAEVVDCFGRPVPIGTPGELWIGGAGVGLGYPALPELTTERFVDRDGGSFYRTGDRVRWRSDGVLEFLGRIDRQVKILGHRIEPDEVESVLSRHSAVESVAVQSVTDPRGTELVAFVASRAGADAQAGQAHVEQWSRAWDTAYRNGEDEFAGWLSSFTGEPIPADQMREWLVATVERIRGFEPKTMADVGVGVGLVLREFADLVCEYHGLDLSAAALEAAAHCLGEGRSLPGSVHLAHAGPEYLRTLPEDSLDLVVVNSVAQYFPGIDYLRTMLDDAVRVARPGGVVFVGDVRRLELLEHFHTAVQISRAPELQPLVELRSAIARRIADERELCLSPNWFRSFAQTCPAVTDVSIELKPGWSDNELTCYRYDVTLQVGTSVPPSPPLVPERSWAELGGKDALRRLLAENRNPVRITGLPDRRLAWSLSAVEAVSALADTATVWDLHRELWDVDPEHSIHPQQLHDLVEQAGRSCLTLVPDGDGVGCFDAVIGAAGRKERS